MLSHESTINLRFVIEFYPKVHKVSASGPSLDNMEGKILNRTKEDGKMTLPGK